MKKVMANIFNFRDWRRNVKGIKEKHKPGTLDYLTALLETMDTDQCLKYEKLTLCEFRVICMFAADMRNRFYVATFMEGVKDWFVKHGFIAELEKEGLNWQIKEKE